MDLSIKQNWNMIMMTGKIDSGAMCSMKVLLVVYLERTSFVEVNMAN